MPDSKTLERTRAERAYWKQYARLFPQHRLSDWHGRDSAVLVCVARRSESIVLTRHITAAIDAARNEGVALGTAEQKTTR